IINYNRFISFTGIPIQIFRAVAAALLAYATLQVLRVFHWETQNRLEEGELRLHTIAAAAPVVLFKHNSQGILSRVEGKNLDGLPIQADALVGKPVSALFPDLDIIQHSNRSWQPNEVYNSHVTAGAKTFELCYAPTRAGDGNISGFVGAALDITQRLEAQAEIEKYRRELGQTRQLTELGTMSKLVANKLRKPLSVAKLKLQRLLLETDTAVNREGLIHALEESLIEINQATDIVQGLYEQAGQAAPKPIATINLDALLQRVATVFAERARRRHVEMHIHVPVTVSALTVTERELEYIASALFECAIEAHSTQTESSQLIITCTENDNTIQLCFRDTGRNLTPEEQTALFKPFPESMGSSQGCGLSMAVVQEITQTHGGTIEIKTDKDQGTSVCLILPKGV
ncbi:ATP-binding protein, partial [Planctomycetota bacterium]